MFDFDHIDEPLLEFGKDFHYCPRQGIANYDVYDSKFEARKTELLIGMVGVSGDIEKLESWLDKCKGFIPGKANSKQPQLFTHFSGFNESSGFKSKLIYSNEIVRTIKKSTLKEILKIRDRNERVSKAVDLFHDHVKFLSQNKLLDVVVCIVPKSFEKSIVKKEIPKEFEETLDQPDEPELEHNFRRALKARTMHYGKPIQLIREYSLRDSAKTQDAATKAWNFCTALYYKCIQTVPWKLRRDINLAPVCYVGISFYRSRDKKSIQTSLAQIFNENGNGVILRGTPVAIDKSDRKPHLSQEQAYNLLTQALNEYKFALETLPARIVLHKSSNFNSEERAGFSEAINELGINSFDLISIQDTNIRFVRDGMYPPRRGSMITIDDDRHILYTRGSVEYYRTYPGMYIPAPLEVRIVESDVSSRLICEEIIALSKMNWNNTQFDGKFPITLGCARKVGEIMKYIDESTKPQIRYAYYM